MKRWLLGLGAVGVTTATIVAATIALQSDSPSADTAAVASAKPGPPQPISLAGDDEPASTAGRGSSHGDVSPAAYHNTDGAVVRGNDEGPAPPPFAPPLNPVRMPEAQRGLPEVEINDAQQPPRLFNADAKISPVSGEGSPVAAEASPVMPPPSSIPPGTDAAPPSRFGPPASPPTVAPAVPVPAAPTPAVGDAAPPARFDPPPSRFSSTPPAAEPPVASPPVASPPVASPPVSTPADAAPSSRFAPPPAVARSVDPSSETPIRVPQPSGFGPPPAAKPGQSQLDGVQSPAVAIEKIAPAEIQVGKPARFSMRLKNTGPVTAEQVVVRDQVPAGTKFVSSTPRAAQGADGSLVWELGSLKPGEESAIVLEVMPQAEGEIGSIATVSFSAQASVRTISTKPQLVVQHSAPPKVLIGENVTLTIKVTNPGTGAATGIVLEEDVPEGLTHSAGKQLEFEIGTLKPGQTRQLELTLKASKAGILTNSISARGDASLTAEDKLNIEVIAPQLQLAINGPSRRYLERKATYDVVVSNPGTATAQKVELVAFLPKGMKFLESNNAGQYDAKAHAVYWHLEELPAQQNGSVQFTAMPTEMGEQKLRVDSRASLNLQQTQEQTVLVEGLAAIFFEVADVADPIEVGKDTTYEIRIVNQGSKASTNIRLSATLPPGIKPLAGEGATRGYVEGQRVLFEPVVRLAPKAEATFKVRGQGLEAGDQRVKVEIISDDITTPIAKEESTRVYTDR